MKEIKELIRNIAEGESSAHAYIIEGKSGSKRNEFLLALVSGLECQNENIETRPCGRCAACVQAAALTSPDIVYMQRSGKSGYRSEDAIAFTERLGMTPYGRYLIGIINEAEALSEIVQNKLLKTLEEPLEKVLLILATSRSDELLATVRSRCSLVRIDEYEGYSGSEESASSEEMAEGAAQILSKEGSFYQFREFTEKNIKSTEDAAEYIGLVEERLRNMMREGAEICVLANGIEAAERTAMDIGRGMDRQKALKRLFLEYKNIIGR
ncbi:MAG: hypothetical protein IKE52_05785 [Mogibacterium sp.]|nr:hypothetical protein [Mogibacterium sp.]